MADPLGFISGSDSARFPSPAPRHAESPAGGPSFKDALTQSLDEVNSAQQDATRAIEDLASGKTQNVEEVILATQKADNAFRMLQALRNKVVEAYDEIKQTRV
jgi:flagellar hook-basal body complex protein FliE